MYYFNGLRLLYVTTVSVEGCLDGNRCLFFTSLGLYGPRGAGPDAVRLGFRLGGIL